MKDDLGDRMKRYEKINDISLPDNTPVIIRIDGKSFHTFCRNMDKPFDTNFISMMNHVAIETIKEIQNARMAYVQSDEISFLLMKKNVRAQPWFNNEIQKMVSISAATASANAVKYIGNCDNVPITMGRLPIFDSRVWTLPEFEVPNYYIWRQNDWTRNSVQMLARSLYSQKELQDKNQEQMHDMIHEKGKNWNDLPTYLKRGRCVIKVEREVPNVAPEGPDVITRHVWDIDNEIPIFTKDRAYITDRLVMEDV
jgi:tRNA(His) 5'-end guanylyltransferase